MTKSTKKKESNEKRQSQGKPRTLSSTVSKEKLDSNGNSNQNKDPQSRAQVIIAIAGVVIAAIALIPSFGQWLSSRSSEILTPTVMSTNTLVTDTPIPTTTQLSTPSKTPITKEIVFRTEKGEIPHNPANGAIEWTPLSDKQLSKYIVEVTFENPYSASEHLWDGGILISGGLRIEVASDGTWSYGYPDANGWINLGKFSIDNLALNKGESNHLKVVVFEKTGCFYVNGKFISELDLSSLKPVTSARFILGSYNNSELEGAITKFKDFVIYRTEFLDCSQ